MNSNSKELPSILSDNWPPEEEQNWLISNVGPLCLSTRPTLLSSWALARHVAAHRIAGDIVECGVFAGGQVIAMWRGAGAGPSPQHHFHLLDSFEGIPHAGPEDTDNIDNTLFSHGKDGALVTSGISACSAAAVHQNLEARGMPAQIFTLYEGWFQQTIREAIHSGDKIGHPPIRQIALLRLDGDLYESTKACWPLIDLVQSGGIVIIDDYALRGCRKAIEEYLEIRQEDPEIIPIPEGGGPVFWIKN